MTGTGAGDPPQLPFAGGSPDTGQSSQGGGRPVYSGPVLTGPVDGATGPGAPGAAARGRQVLELLAGAVRGVAAALRVSGAAGLVAALIITAVCRAGFGLRWWPTLILLVVLALPALEVGLHRLALLRTWGDAERLAGHARTVSGAVLGGGTGAAGDFAERMSSLRAGQGAGRQGVGAVRSAMGLRDLAGAVPELAGALLLPLRRQLLVLTGACTAICWVLLVIGVPVALVVGLIAALVH